MDNISGHLEYELFTDGMSDATMTALSKNRWLLVRARNRTFVYKWQSVDVCQLAKGVGTNFILEGSIRIPGNRVRIDA